MIYILETEKVQSTLIQAEESLSHAQTHAARGLLIPGSVSLVL